MPDMPEQEACFEWSCGICSGSRLFWQLEDTLGMVFALSALE